MQDPVKFRLLDRRNYSGVEISSDFIYFVLAQRLGLGLFKRLL